jgi:hypothetical protein
MPPGIILAFSAMGAEFETLTDENIHGMSS